MTIALKINKETGHRELWLFGKFEASFHTAAAIMDVIVPYALEAAVRVGERKKAEEICRALGVSSKHC